MSSRYTNVRHLCLQRRRHDFNPDEAIAIADTAAGIHKLSIEEKEMSEGAISNAAPSLGGMVTEPPFRDSGEMRAWSSPLAELQEVLYRLNYTYGADPIGVATRALEEMEEQNRRFGILRDELIKCGLQKAQACEADNPIGVAITAIRGVTEMTRLLEEERRYLQQQRKLYQEVTSRVLHFDEAASTDPADVRDMMGLKLDTSNCDSSRGDVVRGGEVIVRTEGKSSPVLMELCGSRRTQSGAIGPLSVFHTLCDEVLRLRRLLEERVPGRGARVICDNEEP